jgi:hypothetical protein
MTGASFILSLVGYYQPRNEYMLLAVFDSYSVTYAQTQSIISGLNGTFSFSDPTSAGLNCAPAQPTANLRRSVRVSGVIKRLPTWTPKTVSLLSPVEFLVSAATLL